MITTYYWRQRAASEKRLQCHSLTNGHVTIPIFREEAEVRRRIRGLSSELARYRERTTPRTRRICHITGGTRALCSSHVPRILRAASLEMTLYTEGVRVSGTTCSMASSTDRRRQKLPPGAASQVPKLQPRQLWLCSQLWSYRSCCSCCLTRPKPYCSDSSSSQQWQYC